jgi:hypothetical protein
VVEGGMSQTIAAIILLALAVLVVCIGGRK